MGSSASWKELHKGGDSQTGGVSGKIFPDRNPNGIKETTDYTDYTDYFTQIASPQEPTIIQWLDFQIMKTDCEKNNGCLRLGDLKALRVTDI